MGMPMLGELEPCMQRLAARFGNMREDLEVVPRAHLGHRLEQLARASFRRRRSKTKANDALAAEPRNHRVVDQARKCHILGEGGQAAGETPPFAGRHLFIPECGAVGRGEIVEVRRHDRAKPDLVVGIEHDVEVLDRERMQPHHVLHGRDPTQQTFGRSDQRPHADLLRLTRRERRRQGKDRPDVERERFEHAFEERVVRVVMAVHEARHDQMVVAIDDGAGLLAGPV